MWLAETFNPLASAQLAIAIPQHNRRARRNAPFSLRLTQAERAQLVAEARGLPLGSYIKAKLLGDAPIRLRRAGAAVEDRPALGQALALLGRSRMAANLNQIAYAANIGALLLTPDIERELRAALGDVRALRLLLVRALGLREEPVP